MVRTKLDQFEIDENGCWVWNGCRRNGYGLMKIGGKKRYAHRVFWEDCHGPIAEGTVLHLRCQNRRCVNPNHLLPVSAKEHWALHPESLLQQNKAKTHCVNGHPFTLENTIIRRNGYRDCRICYAERQPIFRARKRDRLWGFVSPLWARPSSA